MSLLTCTKVRYAVAIAGSLFVLGLALQLPRLVFAVDFPLLTTLFSGIGLFAMVLSPVVMLTIGLLALVPGAARQLAPCER